MNTDAAVSIADLTLLSRFVAADNTLSVTAHGKAKADVNRDGEINAMDINVLSQKPSRD